MREEVRGKRMTGDGSRTIQNMGKEGESSTWNNRTWERREKVPHGTTEHGKRGRKFHMEQTKGTKKPPQGEVALV